LGGKSWSKIELEEAIKDTAPELQMPAEKHLLHRVFLKVPAYQTQQDIFFTYTSHSQFLSFGTEKF
jgi:hypothetical protein